MTDLVVVLFMGGLACFVTFTLAYQLGYAHGRLRELDGDDGGPRLDEIDQADDEYQPARAATEPRP